MLQFKINDTSADLIVTLSELTTINDPNFLFVFTHVTTKDAVKFVKLGSDDLSDYPKRFNKFNINPSLLFSWSHVGEWHYKVYEQVSDVNLSELLTGGLLEEGKLIIDRAIDFDYTKYNEPTSFKTYNG